MDLTEKVAEAAQRAGADGNDYGLLLRYVEGKEQYDLGEFYGRIARAAIAVCAEEMAKVAEAHDGNPCKSETMHPDYDAGQIDASSSIAAAIRSMGEMG